MNYDSVMEFDKIKEKLVDYAYTEQAKEQFRTLSIYLDERELRAKLRETSDARVLIEKAGDPPMTSLGGVRDSIEMAQKGGCLSPEELEMAEAALTAVSRLKTYLCRGKRYEVSLAHYDENLNPLDEVRDEIAEKIRGGQVDDYASKLLKTTRSEIMTAEDKMREKADSIIKSCKEYMTDSFCTTRNGHLCVPVKKDCRSRIEGIVMDKSATGNTLFMEPIAVARLYTEIEMLRLAEENEVRRILYELSALVASHQQVFEENARVIERLDFIFAKGKLSLEMEAIEPTIHTDRHLTLIDARHPLMEKNVCIPLKYKIGRGINGVVITGPNTGGKTVAIKTVALNCMMAQCGLHVPCKAADICMNSQYLCDIGDGQNLSENLSTFSAHIKNVLSILEQVDSESLVIMDELGSGTDPMEGMGIAIAILKKLKESGCLYLVTTHYPEVKTYAEKEEGVINARMTFDKETLSPLYQLVIGEAGESCAFHIARSLGMPEDMLQIAQKAAYGQESVGRDNDEQEEQRHKSSRIQKMKSEHNNQSQARQFRIGDSVMVFPEKKIGIVCETTDERGKLCVQIQGKKIYVSHKRIKLQVAAESLYPEDYDFSTIFESVENRKLSHQMDRKYVEGATLEHEDVKRN